MRLEISHITAHNASDIMAALPDAIGLSLGRRSYGNEHPFAELLAGNPLTGAAYAAGLRVAPQMAGEVAAATIGRGLRSPEFGRALATALQDEARRRFDAMATHRKFCSKVDVTRLGLPENVAIGTINQTLTDVTFGNEYSVGQGVLADGEQVTLHTYGKVIDIDRHTIFNDDQQLIAEAVASIGLAAARLERRLLTAMLEANGTLADGQPIFHASFGNISTGLLDATGFPAGLAALRKQPGPDGHPTDNSVAHMVCSPELEFDASKYVLITNTNDLMSPPPYALFDIHAMAGLPAARWYLLASKLVARSVAFAQLSGQTHPISVEHVKSPINTDGTQLRVRLDTAVAMLGRLGIIRCGT